MRIDAPRKILPALLPLFCLLPAVMAATPVFELTDLFVGGQDDINTYRIPSLISTRRGTVLAFCEGRRDSAQDGSPTHLVLKRGLGNAGEWSLLREAGRTARPRQRNMTWQPMQVLRTSRNGEAYMNPVAVIDGDTGAILLLFNHYAHYDAQADEFGGRGELWLMRSGDEGASWSAPVELTRSVGHKELGPGIGIQLRTGRLVVPVYDGVIYSDDHGNSWQAGGVTPKPAAPNETQVVELADGNLMLNLRGAPQRTVLESRDGGVTWGEPRRDPALTDPAQWGGCQASLIRYSLAREGRGRNRLLFANPADLQRRFDLTVRLSYDEGKTWPVAKLIRKGPGSYSSMTEFPDGTIGIVFESGEIENGRVDYQTRLAFARFNLEWLTDGHDSPSDPR
ncbi:MAG TPA: sialidase family protein [Bryobacteraceae bacterium]|nr:sialidase family protein [Bryobacteraceae bacterium]